MPDQAAIATNQRRNLILEAVKRLGRSGQWVTQPELVSELRKQGFNVQKHHVLRDLKALIAIHPQLERDDGSEDVAPLRGIPYKYRWVGTNAPPETGLSIPEALSLVLVARHLKQALPASLTGALNSLFDRAERTLDLQKKNAEARWKDLICVVPPSQPLMPPVIAGNVLNTVHEALLAGEQIEVTYRNSRNERKNRILHPLGLLLREPSSYLVALSNDDDDPRPFALHRILAAKRTYVSARKSKDFNVVRYANGQGLFGGGKMVTLKARVSPHLAGILEETPLEPEQKLGKPNKEGWRTLKARLRDTWQLRWWIMGEGDRMIVDSPKAIRTAIGSTAAKVAALHYVPQGNTHGRQVRR